MQRIFFYFAFITIVCQLSCGPSTNDQTLTIATAANMQFAMKALTEAFTAQSGIDCDLVVSSSGKLTAQITAGAPYDVFVSADMKYPKEIVQQHLAIDTPQVYAYGKLVLWTLNDDIMPSLSMLKEEKFSHIALANPNTAPYGKAAIEVMKNSQMEERLSEKLVFGESIAQVNQFITSGAAEVGFTAKSVVLSPRMKDQGKWIEIDSKTYTPIEQGMVLIQQVDKDVAPAIRFKAFILSKEAQKILLNFGYSFEE